MVTAGSERLERGAWEALRNVMDPEIPVVSIVDMGMVQSVQVDDAGNATVVVLPTFTGCPAIPVIRQDVGTAVAALEGVRSVDVALSFEPSWTSDRITDEGRRLLNDFGLAPPSGDAPVLITEIGLPRVAVCPFCGSEDTVSENMFGPTPCRALYYCNGCRNPFEQFKPV
jgi:ring-1,2-phenylacetyl-CoA epoxidase subunit PaaD